jgi:uncharacterized protein
MRLRLRDWAARHPVASFIGLVVAWSWGIWSLLFQYGGQGVFRSGAPPEAFLIAALGGLGPSLVGLLLTAWLDGRAGLSALRRRLRDIRLGRWWAAVLVVPAASAVVPLLRAALGHAQDWDAMVELIGPGLALGLSAGLMEEFGWRGFLLPRLLRSHSPMVAAVCVGLVWGGLWHGYADFFGVSGEGWAFWVLMGLLGPGLLTAWSLVLTCVALHTRGSLAGSILVHASISSSALVFGQSYANLADEMLWALVATAVAWAAALALWRSATKSSAPTT